MSYFMSNRPINNHVDFDHLIFLLFKASKRAVTLNKTKSPDSRVDLKKVDGKT